MRARNILLVLFICLAHATLRSQSIRYDTIRYAKDHYESRVNLFKSEPVLTGRVIFLGNSLTEFGDWKILLHDSTVINRGIAADNTFGVMDRLDDVIIRQPGKLYIEIGINDIMQNIPVDIIVKNICRIVDRVKAGSPQTRVFVYSILPTNDNVLKDYPEAFNKGPQTSVVNEQMRLNADEHKFTYVDLNKQLRDKGGKLDERYAESDGLHLNPLGYRTWVMLLTN